MRVLTGLVKAESGRVSLLGNTPPYGSDDLRRVGACLDTPTFYPHLSGRAMLRCLLHTAGSPDRGKSERALQQVGLAEVGNQKIRKYSMGMRQRLALASALIKEPELLILDEPTNGLDPDGVLDVRALIADERRRGRGILISSHRMDEMQRMCDRVVVLHKGRVAAACAVAELRGRLS